jgi:hypothetical protein
MNLHYSFLKLLGGPQKQSGGKEKNQTSAFYLPSLLMWPYSWGRKRHVPTQHRNFYHSDMVLCTEDCIMDMDYFEDYVLYRDSQMCTVVMVWKGWQGQILHKSQLSVCMVSYLCVDKGVQLKSKPKHTGTWLAIAWLYHCLWYHPAVFFSHPLSHCAFVPTRKNLECVAKMLLFQFLCSF